MSMQSSDTFGRRATESLDDTRGVVADGLGSAAAGVRGSADRLPGGEQVLGFAKQTADRLENAADYVRDRPVLSMVDDLQDWVKQNPGPSLLAAAVLGFAIGRTLRRD